VLDFYNLIGYNTDIKTAEEGEMNQVTRMGATVDAITTLMKVAGFDAEGKPWQQEWYETGSSDVRRRVRELRKYGYYVTVTQMGPTVTPHGYEVPMTRLTIRGHKEPGDLPPVIEVKW